MMLPVPQDRPPASRCPRDPRTPAGSSTRASPRRADCLRSVTSVTHGFTLDGLSVRDDDRPVRFAVINVQQLDDAETLSRHTFMTRTADGAFLSVSWDPDQPADRPQRVWVETSAGASMMLIDKPGAWGRYVTGGETRPDYPSRYIPRAVSAGEAMHMCGGLVEV